MLVWTWGDIYAHAMRHCVDTFVGDKCKQALARNKRVDTSAVAARRTTGASHVSPASCCPDPCLLCALLPGWRFPCRVQDDVPPFSDEEAFAIIQQQLGRPLEAVFSSISEQPVAAASLGQVRACVGVLALGVRGVC